MFRIFRSGILKRFRRKKHSSLSIRVVHKQTYTAWMKRNIPIHTFIKFEREVDHVYAAG